MNQNSLVSEKESEVQPNGENGNAESGNNEEDIDEKNGKNDENVEKEFEQEDDDYFFERFNIENVDYFEIEDEENNFEKVVPLLPSNFSFFSIINIFLNFLLY